ncbi:hypothetical protein H3H37_13300 [Duganella sp. LX20W]|uniref:Uncharacterized protein n=1 Tax=Rugamonas brunnea TaxID=2758569 RepID=A0A7W2ESZ9_9BURK|nr:hypothetical protein [Rugamonas brunnea]MBA5638031.1 hypothetical protein [Rugamonas brunnea]
MTHTLAAVFEHRTDANYARDALISAGFDSHNIQLSDAASAGGASRQFDTTASPGATDDNFFDSVRHFFGRLFGTEHDDQRMYAEAIRRGHVVLTVSAASREQAERAAGIVQAFGPADMGQQRAREDAGQRSGASPDLHQSGMGAPQGEQAQRGAAPSASGETRWTDTQSASGEAPWTGTSSASGDTSWAGKPPSSGVPPAGHASQQGGAMAGSMQRASSDAPLPGEGGEVGGATRIYPHPNQDSLNIQRGDDFGDSEETYFRSHWTETFSYTGGTYQEYDPAYRYGASMANSTTYQGSAWDDVEPALREEWQRTYPESRWEKFKEAVKAGWDRMTS